jgi:hypothetical protein
VRDERMNHFLSHITSQKRSPARTSAWTAEERGTRPTDLSHELPARPHESVVSCCQTRHFSPGSAWRLAAYPGGIGGGNDASA